MELQINQTFKNLILPLEAEEYAQLEKNILADGIRDALVIWNDTILDGHNRYELAKKHGLEFKTVSKDFADDSEAKIWIAYNQLGRRNLPTFARAELAKLVEEDIKAKARERQSEFHGNQHTGGLPLKSTEVQQPRHERETRTQLAKIAKISPDTMRRAEVVMEKGTPEMKEKLRRGEMKVNTAYREVQEGTRVCVDCGEEKPASKFHVKDSCMECYNKMRNDKRNGKNTAPNPELFTIEAFQEEFKANADSYVASAKDHVTAHYSYLWKDEANRQIAIAALNDVATAINGLKGLVKP